jgi:REP element-mobilizing transposase RayT
MPASNEPLIVGIEGSFDLTSFHGHNKDFIPDLPNFKLVKNLNDPLVQSADGFMQTNIYKNHLIEYKDQFDFIKESNKPFLVYESPVFRSGTSAVQELNLLYMQRVGWNHFMRQGIFCNENSPPDRFEKIKKDQNIKILPWEAKGDYILFILQKPNDSSLEQVHKVWGNTTTGYWDYVVDCLTHIRMHTDMPIILRGHPKARKSRSIAEGIANSNAIPNVTHTVNYETNTIANGGKGLQKDFDNAWAVVGTTSNTLIESACLGIPTFALDDTAMCWPVSQPNLSYIDNPKLDIPREQWLYDLAYTQYYYHEHQLGVAWNRLKPYYFS